MTDFSGISKSFCPLWSSVPWTLSDIGAEELQCLDYGDIQAV